MANCANKTPIAELVAAVKAHARDNYSKSGWDFVVECWSDEGIAEEIANCRTVAGAIKMMKTAIRPLAERRDEVRAEIF